MPSPVWLECTLPLRPLMAAKNHPPPISLTVSNCTPENHSWQPPGTTVSLLWLVEIDSVHVVNTKGLFHWRHKSPTSLDNVGVLKNVTAPRKSADCIKYLPWKQMMQRFTTKEIFVYKPLALCLSIDFSPNILCYEDQQWLVSTYRDNHLSTYTRLERGWVFFFCMNWFWFCTEGLPNKNALHFLFITSHG